jgi:hypothetical protein
MLTLPEGLQETSIEFMTGYAAQPGCGEDVINVAVPVGTQLTVKPGCEANVFGEFGERAREWWHNLTQ